MRITTLFKVKVKDYGYDNVEELVRWRCTNETGGGLMAELGSHQLDACSIFLGHVHPLAVTGVGGKYFYGKPPSDGETNDYGFQTNYNDRDCDDHVSLTYEFPGKNHPRGPAQPDGTHGNDPNDIVLVTYSSINTNGFENYGECVTGTRGTMIVEKEASVMLYPGEEPERQGAGRPAGDHGDGRCRRVRASRRWTRPRRGGRRSVPSVAGRPARRARAGRRGQPRLQGRDRGLRLLRARVEEGLGIQTSNGCRAVTARWRWWTRSSR